MPQKKLLTFAELVEKVHQKTDPYWVLIDPRALGNTPFINVSEMVDRGLIRPSTKKDRQIFTEYNEAIKKYQDPPDDKKNNG
jgi:hypothetical protein